MSHCQAPCADETLSNDILPELLPLASALGILPQRQCKKYGTLFHADGIHICHLRRRCDIDPPCGRAAFKKPLKSGTSSPMVKSHITPYHSTRRRNDLDLHVAPGEEGEVNTERQTKRTNPGTIRNFSGLPQDRKTSNAAPEGMNKSVRTRLSQQLLLGDCLPHAHQQCAEEDHERQQEYEESRT